MRDVDGRRGDEGPSDLTAFSGPGTQSLSKVDRKSDGQKGRDLVSAHRDAAITSKRLEPRVRGDTGGVDGEPMGGGDALGR